MCLYIFIYQVLYFVYRFTFLSSRKKKNAVLPRVVYEDCDEEKYSLYSAIGLLDATRLLTVNCCCCLIVIFKTEPLFEKSIVYIYLFKQNTFIYTQPTTNATLIISQEDDKKDDVRTPRTSSSTTCNA